ncbi:MAG TPA: hypothetical protein VIM02_02225 [Rhizomicrobium sp.]|jgi:tetratricopeptide (TPR) repeat protein
MGAIATGFFRSIPGTLAVELSVAVKAFVRSSSIMRYIGSVSAVCSFATDFLKPVLHYGTLMLFWFAFIALTAVGILVYRGKLKADRAAATIVFCLITAFLSLGLYAWQKAEHDPPDGVFGQLLTAVKDLQKATGVLASAVNSNTKAVNSNSDALRENSALEKSVIRSNQALLDAINRTTGVPIGALAVLLIRVEENTGAADVQRANGLLWDKAHDYVSLKTQLARLTSDDPQARALQRQAQTAFNQANFDEASLKARQAAEVDRTSSLELTNLARAHALAAARSLEKSASLARMALQYRAATDDLNTAAKLAAPFDPHYAWQLTTAKADTLVQQGDELGDQAAIGDAVEVYRSALSMIPQDSSDYAKSRGNLGLALGKLGSANSETLGRHQDAIAAYRDVSRASDRRQIEQSVRERSDRIPDSSRARSRMAEQAETGRRALGRGSNVDRVRSLPRSRERLATGRLERGNGTLSSSAAALAPARAAEDRGVAQSEESGGFFSRIKRWAGGSSSSAPSEAARSPLDSATQSIRPSTVEEQRGLLTQHLHGKLHSTGTVAAGGTVSRHRRNSSK